MDSTDLLLLIWFGFPPIAFLLAQLYGRRIRLTPEVHKHKPNDFLTFVPSTYAYYPVRNHGKEPEPPTPAATTYKKDAALATLAVILGVVGLYLPLTGILPGVIAMLVARPVIRRNNYHYCRAACGFCLGAMTLVQTALYFLCV